MEYVEDEQKGQPDKQFPHSSCIISNTGNVTPNNNQLYLPGLCPLVSFHADRRDALQRLIFERRGPPQGLRPRDRC